MAKQHPADREADRVLAIQRELAPRTRRGDIVLIALCSLFILIFAVGIYCIPHRSFSEVENSSLQTFPRVSSSGKFLDRVWDGRFMAELKDFYTDQFPLRDSLVATKAKAELLLGKSENNGVIPGKDGYLIKRIEYSEAQLAQLQENLDAVTAFRDKTDLPVTFAIAPRAVDVLDRYFPALYDNTRADAVWNLIDIYAAEQPLLSLREPLRACVDAGKAVWYRTDHHWTTLGAYYAYTQYAAAAGLTPHTLDQFERVEYPGFLGTYYSSSGITSLAANPDTVIAYRPMGTNKMKMTMPDGTVYDWYVVNDVSDYASSVKYGCFAGGDQPYNEVENPAITDGSACLVIKDSYGNAFIPFLVDHYQYLYWVDFRYYKGSIYDLVEQKGIRDVVVVQNIYNTAAEGTLSSLQALIER